MAEKCEPINQVSLCVHGRQRVSEKYWEENCFSFSPATSSIIASVRVLSAKNCCCLMFLLIFRCHEIIELEAFPLVAFFVFIFPRWCAILSRWPSISLFIKTRPAILIWIVLFTLVRYFRWIYYFNLNFFTWFYKLNCNFYVDFFFMKIKNAIKSSLN